MNYPRWIQIAQEYHTLKPNRKLNELNEKRLSTKIVTTNQPTTTMAEVQTPRIITNTANKRVLSKTEELVNEHYEDRKKAKFDEAVKIAHAKVYAASKMEQRPMGLYGLDTLFYGKASYECKIDVDTNDNDNDDDDDNYAIRSVKECNQDNQCILYTIECDDIMHTGVIRGFNTSGKDSSFCLLEPSTILTQASFELNYGFAFYSTLKQYITEETSRKLEEEIARIKKERENQQKEEWEGEEEEEEEEKTEDKKHESMQPRYDLEYKFQIILCLEGKNKAMKVANRNKFGLKCLFSKYIIKDSFPETFCISNVVMADGVTIPNMKEGAEIEVSLNLISGKTEFRFTNPDEPDKQHELDVFIEFEITKLLGVSISYF